MTRVQSTGWARCGTPALASQHHRLEQRSCLGELKTQKCLVKVGIDNAALLVAWMHVIPPEASEHVGAVQLLAASAAGVDQSEQPPRDFTNRRCAAPAGSVTQNESAKPPRCFDQTGVITSSASSRARFAAVAARRFMVSRWGFRECPSLSLYIWRRHSAAPTSKLPATFSRHSPLS